MDWEKALVILGEHSPNLHLSFEDYRAENLIRFYDPEWRRHFPDLSDKDVAEFERLAKGCEERIRSYNKGAKYLRGIIKENGLHCL
jgi:hypothetical protein